jgi:hypothetical protein
MIAKYLGHKNILTPRIYYWKTANKSIELFYNTKDDSITAKYWGKVVYYSGAEDDIPLICVPGDWLHSLSFFCESAEKAIDWETKQEVEYERQKLITALTLPD